MVYCAPHYAAFFGAVLWLVAMDPRRVAFAQGPNPHGLYVPPAPTFIHDASEAPVALDFGLTSLAHVQTGRFRFDEHNDAYRHFLGSSERSAVLRPAR